MTDQLREGDECPQCKKGIMKRIPLGRDVLEKPNETQDYQKLQCDKCENDQGHRNVSTG